MNTIIVIPARYNSKRFPGKPLASLEGKAILERVWEIASFAASRIPNCGAVVATETPSEDCPSEKIISFCESHGINVVTTSNACRSGSDRVWEVVSKMAEKPNVVVNLQGDVPTCPPDFIEKLVKSLEANTNASAATIYTKLSWDALDAFREAKKTSPFSGTSVIVSPKGEALWFSKNIIPAIRDEKVLRERTSISPILRHIGIYAYRYEALQFFAGADKGEYERLEQLEQLRFLENGMKIMAVEGCYPRGYDRTTSGVDSQDDLERVAEIIRQNGELLSFYR